MAARRLINIVATLTNADNPQAIRNDRVGGRSVVATKLNSNHLQTAKILAVSDSATIVRHGGKTVLAGAATDTPFRAGQTAWVAPVKGGGVVALGLNRR